MNTINKISLKRDQTNIEKIKILDSKTSADYIRKFYHEDITIYESFFILLLDRSNNTIGFAKISQGGIAGTVIDIRIIMKYIIDTFASGVILCHNHPSGNLNPSEMDKKGTEKIKEVAKMFECKVLDHIILTDKGFYSFADEGTI